MLLHRKFILFLALASGLPSLAHARLEISGVDGELERNVRAFVSLDDEPCDAEDWLIRRRYRALEKQARESLEPFGYYQPSISTQLTTGGNCWQATLEIDPGEPVRYRTVDIVISGEAATDASFSSMPRREALQPGQVLRHADYDALKRQLQTLAADRGYLEASFSESRLDVWPAEGAADVKLHFISGPRYRLGEILIEQSFLDPAVARGFIDLTPGAWYDSAELSKAHQDLSESAYFGTVDIGPDLAKAKDGRVPIRISMQPGTRVEYTVGAGVSTDTGIRIRGGFRYNRLNKGGHQLLGDAYLSPLRQGLTTEYRIPRKNPRREWFSVAAAVLNEETDTFDTESQRIGLRWTKLMSNTWLYTLSLDVSNESFNIADDVIADDVTTSRLVVPGVKFDQKVADADVFPSRGHRLEVELNGTDESLGSTTSYAQAKIWTRWIRSFGTGNRILLRLKAGTTASQDFNLLPPSVRFFAGGDESVRGYDYESLGPEDADGNVIGGTNLLVASVEYERLLKGNFYGAAFVDSGNAFDNTDFNPETGVGVGLKWRSPLGLIRAYLGYPVTADEDKSVKFHLRLGADL
jgi:translocation and assembly module TamA